MPPLTAISNGAELPLPRCNGALWIIPSTSTIASTASCPTLGFRTTNEKLALLCAERGDISSTRRVPLPGCQTPAAASGDSVLSKSIEVGGVFVPMRPCKVMKHGGLRVPMDRSETVRVFAVKAEGELCMIEAYVHPWTKRGLLSMTSDELIARTSP